MALSTAIRDVLQRELDVARAALESNERQVDKARVSLEASETDLSNTQAWIAELEAALAV